MIQFIERVVTASHKHPLFSLALVLGFVGWVTFSLQTFATAQELEVLRTQDIEQLRGQVLEIRGVVERGQLEQRIYGLESEIYGLERVIAEGAARDMDHARLSRLRSDLGSAKRALERFDRG